jgi:proline iminopeptidase
MKRAAILIMLLVGSTMVAPRAEVKAQETPAARVREGHIVTDDGVRLRYRMIGSGADAVIVANTAAWLEDELATLARDRTLIFFDARNRGGSDRVTDPQRLGMDREVRDIDEIRRQLGFDRVALIGWSYVGALVTLYARENPDRVSRLVLIGTMAPRAATIALGRGRGAGPDQAGVARIAALRADTLDRSNPTGFCREHVRLVDLPPRMGDHGAIEHYRSDPCRFENEWPANLSASVGAVIARLGAWDWRQSVDDVQVPALVVHGTDDFVPIEGAIEWVTALPEARLVRVAGAGHLPWLEAPDAVLGAIDTFLNGAWPATAERVPGEKTTPHVAGETATAPAMAPATAQPARPEQALDAFFDALSRWDYDGLGRTVTTGFELVEDTLIFDLAGLIAFARGFEAAGATMTFELDDFNTAVRGPVAWTRYRNRAVLRLAGGERSLTFIESAVLELEDGGWRIDRLQSNPLPDITPDVAAVRELHAAWVTAYTTGDLQRFMQHWSDDGIMMPPNAPAVAAPDAVRAAAAGLFTDFDIAIQPTIEDVIVSGDWAIVRWRSSSALTPRAGGATTSVSGKALWVLRRDPDGAWRLIYDIWNSDGS